MPEPDGRDKPGYDMNPPAHEVRRSLLTVIAGLDPAIQAAAPDAGVKARE
jgi:hypothetical protein